MQRLLFELSPAFILLCILLGLVYAFILYRARYIWSRTMNRVLFCLRAMLATFLAFLLLGPILKLTKNIFEKPAFAVVVDNSLSVREGVDSLQRASVLNDIFRLKDQLEEGGYEVKIRNLANEDVESNLKFSNTTSDLNGAIREVTDAYEGRNLAGIVLVSDGLYNSGTSPLYNPLRAPVYTIGIGDTLERTDLLIKTLSFNKIAYQGNKFPLRAEVMVKGQLNTEATVSVFQGGKLVKKETKNFGKNQLLNFDFQVDATEKGLQRLDVVLNALPEEANKQNNRASAYVEVVEGKKRILAIAPSPHPDLKVLRSVLEKNANYDFVLHIPGVKEATAASLENPDLVIFHQVADADNKTTALLNRYMKSGTSLLVTLGAKTNLRQLPALGVPLTFENQGQWDDVLPVVNMEFRSFGFADTDNTRFTRYPPITVPFGKFTYPPGSQVLLYQRIGSVTTNRPLLLSYEENARKTGVLLGEGIWKWRLNEFSETEKTAAFDEVFGKLIQYLSTKEDRRRFKCFPIQTEFSDADVISFESQVYNDLFEQVYGNTIGLELTDEQGQITRYNYVTGPGSSRYRIGSLKEGVYRYRAQTEVNQKREEVRGEFLVAAQNIEAQNLTADFNLLRKFSAQTGGSFYLPGQLTQLESTLKNGKLKSMIHSDETFNPLINLKWVFFALLALVSLEWFLRKYLGSY